MERLHALSGFNMTQALLQELFAEVDPHKKGFLTESDWVHAFSAFGHSAQTLIELKNTVQCNFTDCDSAFQFFLSFKNAKDTKKNTLNAADFDKAVNSLTGGTRFSKKQIDVLWKVISDHGKYITIDKYIFRAHFETLNYTGNSTVTTVKTAPTGA